MQSTFIYRSALLYRSAVGGDTQGEGYRAGRSSQIVHLRVHKPEFLLSSAPLWTSMLRQPSPSSDALRWFSSLNVAVGLNFNLELRLLT